MRRRASLLLLLLFSLTLVFAFTADARVGGGSSFGGGGGGGSGGDGGGEIIYLVIRLLLWLCLEHPVIGIPLTITLVIVTVVVMIKKGQSPSPANITDFTPVLRSSAKTTAMALKSEDPNYSEILFLDFVQMIYARYQEARGAKGDPDALTPYLTPPVLEKLRSRRRVDKVIEQVIVGSSTITAIDRGADGWMITVDLETNFTERPAAEKDSGQAWYTRTRLNFQRQAGVKSKGPEFTEALSCPSCGSPVKVDADGACAYCGTVVKPGEFAWQLTDLTELTVKRRQQVSLSLGGVEVGTDRPTVYAPNLLSERKAFALADPEFKWDEFQERVRTTFFALQSAWTEKEWEKARPYETDRLFQMHLFWMQRYRDNNYANKLENIELEKIEVAKIERDPYFDVIAVRLFASMIDYTVNREGKVVEGSKRRTRKFSEYWTFIRKAGFKKKEPQSEWDEPADRCPSCGAPLKVSMHGVCEYCGSNITAGDFDWTLAKIEQDEVYRG